MTGTKILIGQIMVVFALIIGAVWLATQLTAEALGFQPALGFLAAIIGSVLRSRHERHVTTYGSARWASPADLKRAGLFANAGVFLGRWQKRYLRHDGPEHVMAFAPTRSGKGVGLVVPTLLSWTGSAVIHDIKGENWELTSGWRSKFSRCVRFDPTDRRSPKYNPLLAVRPGEHEVRDVQNIADILVDPEGSLERRNHWEKTGHALLVGVILHVLYAEEDKTLSGCVRFLSDPKRSFAVTLRTMMTTPHLGERGVHPIVAQAARELLNKSENERSGVLSTAMSFLSLYRDPVIAEVTSRSDWRIEDLVEGECPLSLYLVVPPSDLSRTKPLIRLILNQIGRRLTEDLPKEERRKLLFMLDEFPALGRLDFFESALAFMAGYGIRAYLIAQSLNQIEKAYGPNNSILDNCHVRIAFATNDERTAKRVSDALGTTTELRSQKNYTGHRLAPWLSHMMVSRQETQRALITPGEVMQLSASDEIVMVSGAPPVHARKLRYFKDRNFTKRVLSAAPVGWDDDACDAEWTSIVAAPSFRELEAEDSGRPDRVSLKRSREPKHAKDEGPEKRAPEPVLEADIEDEAKPASDQNLETERRAIAADRGDPDVLPGF